jgi:DNA helicase II / ATP-dependent DNA helicase PcrA
MTKKLSTQAISAKPLSTATKSNKLIVAAAGSGKTTKLVQEALSQKEGRVLITTYTQANESEIRKKIIELNKFIPENVTVQTWFSFLLKHGVRPFQPVLYQKRIKGLILVNEQSGLKYRSTKGFPVYFKEDGEFEHHYFSSNQKIYSDKLSKFVFRCNEKSNGAVVDRISRIFTHIFIDEVQDLAGFDLELLKLFFNCQSNVLLVGDPRQGTYSTNTTAKNKKFRKAEIMSFFDQDFGIEIDDKSLLINYRCNSDICSLSNKLFPDYPNTQSGNTTRTGHDGIFFVKESDIKFYLEKYVPIQLRNDARTEVNMEFSTMNFGESKGLTFERVLVYPTKPITDWLKSNAKELAPTSKSKFYVALTRAKHSVGIVFNYGNNNVDGITNFSSSPPPISLEGSAVSYSAETEDE